MDKFFVEDVVALKVEPRIIGIITSTWLDLDPMITVPDDWITHADISSSVLDECIEKGKPPENHVIVEFLQPYSGTAVVSKDDLVLRDRGLAVGDVVKASPTDSQSGTITNTHIRCRIQPIYTDLPYQGSEPWPYRPEDNELWVSSKELRYWDFRDQDYVAYKGWIGQIIGLREEVTVRLQDGNAVRVKDPLELECPFWAGDYRRVNRRFLEGNSLAQNLHTVRRMLSDTVDRDAMSAPPSFYPGLKVQTKKSNLRLGQWVIGSYNASTPPKGVVVETRVIEIDVEWVTTNVFDPSAARSEPPNTLINTDELDQVRLCDTYLPSSQFGSRVMREMMPGDLCRFRDEPAAAEIYTADSGEGYFRRIPRTSTQGFHMNTLRIMESKTDVEVLWQDGSRSTLESKAVIPYINIDEHDLWPGEAVSIKEKEVHTDGIVRAHKIGVVQSVDATDRVANVRWYSQPDVACFEVDAATIVPGSNAGELSDETSTVSLYEVVGFPAMMKKRGDIVLLSPAISATMTQNWQPPRNASSNPTTWFSNFTSVANLLINGPVVPTETAEGLPWVGEVVDLGLDGYLTVRLGALDEPKDVKCRADKALMLVGADEDSLLGDEDDDASMDDFIDSDEESIESAGTIAEEIEYEGGERLDNGDETAWQTDEDEEEDEGTQEDTHMGGTDPEPVSQSEAKAEVSRIADTAPTASPPLSLSPPLSQTEYQFNEHPSMPPQFLVLDEAPPSDHHFVSHDHTWNTAGSLRRIRREHKLLQSSLPRGIWVRTWATRLDLLRIMIIGPRGTPYALAPFVFDFAFPSSYPKDPPEAFFHSWTNGMGRINPNLYEDGKVCLSILGTWPGSEKTESWSAEHSSMMQVLVSLLGLVLVERPYYNEAGFETLVGTEDNVVNERVYSEKALVMAKGFVVYALRTAAGPSPGTAGIADVIEWVYRATDGPQVLRWVLDEAKRLREQGADVGGGEGKLSRGILIILDRYLPVLEEMAGALSVQQA